MGMLDEIVLKEVWEGFLSDKKEKGLLSKRDQRYITDFIGEERYLSAAEELRSFSVSGIPVPRRITINKTGTGKKRTVYSFDKDYSLVLKLIAYLLYRYDGKISPRCYSFRRNMNAKSALRDIVSVKGINDRWFYKTDIHDYFNSIPPAKLINILKDTVTDDPELLDYLSALVTQERYSDGEEVRIGSCGAMAGVPVSSFFADIYLRDLDRLFDGTGIEYFRYSDDIIIFARTQKEIRDAERTVRDMLSEYGLQINSEKEMTGRPGEPWEYLGFRYEGGRIGLSRVSVSKIKAKIRRKARSLYRWRKRKDVSFEKTAGKMISIFNRKFFDERDEKDFTWSRWYFPVIDDPSDLRTIDRYLADSIRYLKTGRHSKSNYSVRYEQLKELGFRSLYNEYFRWKKSSAKCDVIIDTD